MRLTLAHRLSATEPLSSRGLLGGGGGRPKKVSFSFSSSALRLAHPILRLISWAAWGGGAEKSRFYFHISEARPCALS